MAAETGVVESASAAIRNIDLDAAMIWAQTQGLEFLMKLAAAIAIFIIGRIAIRIVTSGMQKAMQRHEVDRTLQSFVTNIVRIMLLIVVILMALGTLGVQTTSFVAILGENEIAAGKMKLKNMKTGEEVLLAASDAASEITKVG